MRAPSTRSRASWAFEAILAGHRPVTFGMPFYAGWGLTDDRRPVPARRGRALTRAQLVAAAMILYPVWYDPHRDRLCPVEDTLAALEAQARAWREDRHGYAALAVRDWKHAHHRAFFRNRRGGAWRSTRTQDPPWAKAAPFRSGPAARTTCSPPPARAPTGRSCGWRTVSCARGGLGARLIPPLSLVQDDLGIYYDPTRESRFERLVAEAAMLDAARLRRAERLITALTRQKITKYNLGGDAALPELPGDREIILVPGQVEDDASVLRGAGDVDGNLDLLRTARRLHPTAYLIYKPHPDVEAGLRKGAVPIGDLVDLADHVAKDADPTVLIRAADRVVTMTSGIGFEALIRKVPVTTLGAPFYAGWGLTTDLGAVPARRKARPSLAAFVHAALILYPRYHDPVTGLPCPVEVAVERLANGVLVPRKSILARLQSLRGRIARAFTNR